MITISTARDETFHYFHLIWLHYYILNTETDMVINTLLPEIGTFTTRVSCMAAQQLQHSTNHYSIITTDTHTVHKRTTDLCFQKELIRKLPPIHTQQYLEISKGKVPEDLSASKRIASIFAGLMAPSLECERVTPSDQEW